MYKKIFLVLGYTFFSFSSVSAISLIDINDVTKDKALKPQYLSQYIRTVFNSRAACLRQKIEELTTQKDGFTSLGLDKRG